jgi:hypothetical protein
MISWQIDASRMRGREKKKKKKHKKGKENVIGFLSRLIGCTVT